MPPRAKPLPLQERLDLIAAVIAHDFEDKNLIDAANNVLTATEEQRRLEDIRIAGTGEEPPKRPKLPSATVLVRWVKHEKADPGFTANWDKMMAGRVPRVITMGTGKDSDEESGRTFLWRPSPRLMAKLRLEHECKCDLIYAERDYEQEVELIWRAVPVVGALMARRDELDAQLKECVKAIGVARSKARPRVARLGDTHPLIIERKEIIKGLSEVRAELNKERKANGKHVKGKIKAAQDARDKVQSKDLYRKYTYLGLYWATFNDILEHHRTAVQMIIKKRTAGRRAQLNLPHFDGTGTLTVQLQRQYGEPLRNAEALRMDSTSKWANQVRLPWIDPQLWKTLTKSQQRKAGHEHVRIRIGQSLTGEIEYETVPVQAHRFFPADADVTLVRLTIGTVADTPTLRVSITGLVEAPPERTEGATVALHVGWKQDASTGDIITGHWRSDTPIPIPERLRGIMNPNTAQTSGRITLPARFAERLKQNVDDVQSERAKALDKLRDEIADWMEGVENLESVGPFPHPWRNDPDAVLASVDLARWRSPAAFRKLLNAWKSHSPLPNTAPVEAVEGLAKIIERMDDWQRWDLPEWRRCEHGRQNILAGRDEWWKLTASVIATHAKTLIVDNTVISDLAKKEDADDSDDLMPSSVATMLRRRRMLGAPGFLRQYWKSAVLREGGQVVEVSATNLSREHICGTVNKTPGYCVKCDKEYDTNECATELMHRRAQAA